MNEHKDIPGVDAVDVEGDGFENVMRAKTFAYVRYAQEGAAFVDGTRIAQAALPLR